MAVTWQCAAVVAVTKWACIFMSFVFGSEFNQIHCHAKMVTATQNPNDFILLAVTWQCGNLVVFVGWRLGF